MNKKLILSLSIAVLAVTALFAGNQTIKSINNEPNQTTSSTVNEANNITTVKADSSSVLISESKEAVKPVAAAESQAPALSDDKSEEKKISSAEAEAIALDKAGFSAAEVYDKEVELDYEKGVLVYEVSFEKDRIDYDYIIDAASGEVLHSKSEQEDKDDSKPVETAKSAANEDKQSSAQPKAETSTNRISASEAEAIALKKAGFSAAEVYDKEVELDYEKGVLVYEVSFEKDRVDYDYVIDAASGEVLHSKSEQEDKDDSKPVETTKAAANEDKQSSAQPKAETSTKRISASEAEAIALKKAGFSASSVYNKEVELDYEKGVLVYEVSFEKERTDYDYVIDAVSGEVLHSEIDFDD